jgi:hypothetical protein
MHTDLGALEALQADDLERWLDAGERVQASYTPWASSERAASGATGRSAAAAGGFNLDPSYIRYPHGQKPGELQPLAAPEGGGSWYVQQKTIDGYAEFVAIHDPEGDLLRGHGAKNTVAPFEQPNLPELEVDFEEQFRKNALAARRSKRGLKWAVLGLGGDRIFTLTQRDLIPSYQQAWSLWSRFEQSCSKRFENFKCVAVVEPHKNQGYHIHFVCNRFFDVSSMRLWWHRVLTGRALRGILRGDDSPGNIQVGSPHGTRKIAKYLSKYLGKSFEAIQSVRIKRYAASKGIRAPLVTRTRMPSSAGGEVHRLRCRAEADGWKVEAVFEGAVMGRALIWMQCSRRIPVYKHSIARCSTVG